MFKYINLSLRIKKSLNSSFSYVFTMDVININKDERVLINQAKIKYLKDNPNAKSTTNSAVCLEALNQYVGGKHGKHKRT